MEEREARLAASWRENAEAWARVVRDGAIQSRTAGTDAAIIAAIERALGARSPARVLDAGCGEGWLGRSLAARGIDVVGIDATAALIERARELASPRERYETAAYADLIADREVARGPFDLAVANFALLGQDLSASLAALRDRLGPGGVLLVQTVHPWLASGDEGYQNGWRLETWNAFGERFPSPMPWYFRTMSAWAGELAEAGFVIRRLDEPRHVETDRPLSIIFECVPHDR